MFLISVLYLTTVPLGKLIAKRGFPSRYTLTIELEKARIENRII
jgi:hypothetical protein